MKAAASNAVALALSLAAAPLAAGEPVRPFVVVNEAAGVPVFPGDLPRRPYDVIGEIRADVRKATLFSEEASVGKIYRELWERAARRGADAVINARYGDSHVTALSWGSTTATGTAIKFRTAPAAAPQP